MCLGAVETGFVVSIVEKCAPLPPVSCIVQSRPILAQMEKKVLAHENGGVRQQIR